MLKKLIKVLFIVALAYAIGRFVVVFKDSRLVGQREPYIQMLSSDSVIIHWMSEDNELGVVRYGEDSSHMSNVVLEDSRGKNHIVKITNLEPGIRYFYQTGDIDTANEFDPDRHWFYTHTDKVVPTRIWVIGDSGEPGETLNQVRDSAFEWMKDHPLASDKHVPENTPLIDIWLSLGDIAYRSGTNEQFQAALFDTFRDLTGNTSFWPVYGNHDERRWTYFRIFDLPENGESGGIASHTENYYSFDYSNVHVVMLDSQDSSRSKTGDMATWLKQDLAANTLPWVVVAFHHPPYTKGSHDSDDDSDSRGRMSDMRENILPILERGGVDLVLSGHSHLYERSYLLDCAYADSSDFSDRNRVSSGVNEKHQNYIKPLQKTANQGTVYVVAGSASKVDNGALDHPAHVVGLKQAGTVVVDIDHNKLTARFINQQGEVGDEFSITKEADYVSGYSGCEAAEVK